MRARDGSGAAHSAGAVVAGPGRRTSPIQCLVAPDASDPEKTDLKERAEMQVSGRFVQTRMEEAKAYGGLKEDGEVFDIANRHG